MPPRVVLHVLEAIEGGTSRHLTDLVRNTHGWEHHVALPSRRVGAPTDLEIHDRLRAAGATTHLVPMRRSPVTPTNASAVLRLRRLVRSLGPTVVHGHSSIGGALARVVATTTRVPCVYTPNGLATGRGARLVERVLARRTDVLVAVSESERKELARLAPRSSVVTIPNGIEPSTPPTELDLRSLAGIPPGAPLVGTVARLHPQKAPERFISVAERVLAARADAHVMLVGDGVLREEVAALVAAAGARQPMFSERFHWLREVPGVGAALGALDVFVLLSRFEGAPYTPMEAMRSGTPAVLSDVVGNRDAIEDEVSGLLVSEGDLDAAVAAVLRLLDDDDLRSRLGAAGAARVRDQFDVRSMGTAFDALYAELAEKSLTHRQVRRSRTF